MAIRDAIVGEFDHEMANTRKTLERVPEEKMNWRPHQKSYTMQQLASHVASIPGWIEPTIKQDSLDVAPPGSGPYAPPLADSVAGLLEMFDDNVAKAREALSTVSDEELQKPWSLLFGGQVVFTMPKVAVLRSFVMNHGIHHRAQLGVYLRLNDAPVPALYGPSADESAM